jgi:hypothetical protein
MAEHFIRSIEFWTVSCKTRQPRQPQRAAHGAGRWRSAPRTAPVDSAAARAPPTQPAAAAPHSAGRWRSAPRTAPVDGAAARAPPTQTSAARRRAQRRSMAQRREPRRLSQPQRAAHGAGRHTAAAAAHGAGRWRSTPRTADVCQGVRVVRPGNPDSRRAAPRGAG